MGLVTGNLAVDLEDLGVVDQEVISRAVQWRVRLRASSDLEPVKEVGQNDTLPRTGITVKGEDGRGRPRHVGGGEVKEVLD